MDGGSNLLPISRNAQPHVFPSPVERRQEVPAASRAWVCSYLMTRPCLLNASLLVGASVGARKPFALEGHATLVPGTRTSCSFPSTSPLSRTPLSRSPPCRHWQVGRTRRARRSDAPLFGYEPDYHEEPPPLNHARPSQLSAHLVLYRRNTPRAVCWLHTAYRDDANTQHSITMLCCGKSARRCVSPRPWRGRHRQEVG